MPDAWDYSQPRRRQFAWPTQVPLITSLLCAVCVVVTLASMTSSYFPSPLWIKIGQVGAVDPAQLWRGQWWGLLTPFFLHAGIVHLGFDMLWLFTLGRLMEARLNPFLYVLFIAVSAAVGTASELLVSHSTGIGASGVVYAMMGLMWAGRGRYPEWQSLANRDNLRLFLGWGVFCIVATYLHFLNIANGAHVGGFIFGISVGWLAAAPRPHWIWAAPLAALLALNVLALAYMPWSSEWTFWKAGQELDRAHYAQAVRWYKRTLAQGSDPHAAWYNMGLAWEGTAHQAAQANDAAKAQQARMLAAQAFQTAGPDTDDNP